ncbi:MAG: MATE family efflux transporter [Anaerotignaceae bacterium]
MKNISMTEGNIFKQILMFTLPLLLGNLFQQMYNTVDVIVVGNYVGKDALAAVGSSTPIINMLVGFFVGVSTGASVVIAQFFGAGDKRKLRDAVHASIWATIVLGVLFTLLGVVFSPFMLRIIKTPNEVFYNAVLYLRIYFFSIGALMIYNMGAAILRAVGDSKRPLYFLCFSSIINIVLDILFVVVFKMGIAGVAWATLVAQVMSAVLVMVLLFKTQDVYKVEAKYIVYNGGMINRIMSIGLPSGFQQMITALSNLIVQSYINQFGSAAIAGFSTYLKIDNLLILPIQSIALAIITFTGQNLGAGKISRAKEGVNVALIMAMVFDVSMCLLLFFMGKYVLRVFSPDPEVLYYGNMLIKTFMPVHFTLGICLIYSGALRGFGQAIAPMVIMIGCFVVLRQVFLLIGTHFIPSFNVIALGYPITWVASGITTYLYYKKGGWEKKYIGITENNKGVNG